MNDITLCKNWLNSKQSNVLFYYLDWFVEWTGNRITESGQTIKIKRKMAYYNDDGSDYNYAGLQLKGQKWLALLKIVKKKIEEGLNISLNSVLLNLYEDGKSEIRWHSDKEPQLGDNPIIPCINLGATRKFWFLEKGTSNKFYHEVGHGDLLVMGPNCQQKYLHAVLKEKEVTKSRISLTFRKVYDIVNKS
jgi:alkylated DNA repair dioxygenase AlkB